MISVRGRWKFIAPLASGVVASTLVLSACGSSSGSDGGGSGPIVIGASYSLTGPYASSSKNVKDGYAVAIKEINESGGLLGRKLKLVTGDDQSDAGTATKLYNKFISKDHVDLLLSPYGSALSGAAAQLAERNKIPMVHSLTSSTTVFKDTKWNVQAGLPPSEDLLENVPAFLESEGFKTVALVGNDLDAYTGICAGVKAEVQKVGLKIVYSETYAADTSDFSSTALKIRRANPEAVVGCTAIQDSIGLTRAIHDQGFRPKVLVNAVVEEPEFEKAVGALSNGVIGYSVFTPVLTDREGVSRFVKEFKAMFQTEPSSQAADAYAAVQTLAAAIKKAGSADAQKLNQALHSGSYDNVLGTYKVDANGVQNGYHAVVVQRIGKDITVVFPKDVATAAAKLPY